MKNLTGQVLLLTAAIVMSTLACSAGDGESPDAGGSADGALDGRGDEAQGPGLGTDGAHADGLAGDVPAETSDDASATTDSSSLDGSDTKTGSNPPVSTAAIKILPKGAQFVGATTTSCSYGPASQTAHARWCAFALPSATAASLELWVMNMAKAPTRCDGSSADCIRLTSNLFAEKTENTVFGSPLPSFPSAHRFYGDTLIFYADATVPASQLFLGPAYSWQPGWATARQLSGSKAAS